MEQPFNEQSSLQLIESMINKAKNSFSESGTLYLLWGIVIFICSLTQFFADRFNYENANYIWFLTWIVAIYQVFYLSRRSKKERAKTYAAEMIKYVWICFACCLFLCIYVLIYKKAYDSIIPVILVMYGMPTFLTGTIIKFRSLIVGSISCWTLSIVSILLPNQYQTLCVCAAVVIAWIIPGYLFHLKYKTEQAS